MRTWISFMIFAVTASALDMPTVEYLDNSQTYGFGLPGNTDIVRYWDCSKQECSNPMASLETTIDSCSKDEEVLSNPYSLPAFDGGPAYICSAQQQPVAINDEYSYAYVSVPQSMMTDGSSDTCCRCLEIVLGVTTTAGVPKKLLAQIVNNGVARFDLQVPGAGIGDWGSCHLRYDNVASYNFGDQQAGFSAAQYTVAACQNLPSILQPGCEWLFNWYDRNNEVKWYQEIVCPEYLTENSQCARADNITQGNPLPLCQLENSVDVTLINSSFGLLSSTQQYCRLN